MPRVKRGVTARQSQKGSKAGERLLRRCSRVFRVAARLSKQASTRTATVASGSSVRSGSLD